MSHSFALAEHFLSHAIVGIEDLCTKRDELQKQIINEEEEKSKIQNDIRILSERLAKINESLAKKIASRNEYDKTISETEAAYMKVSFDVEDSQPFLLFAIRLFWLSLFARRDNSDKLFELLKKNTDQCPRAEKNSWWLDKSLLS